MYQVLDCNRPADCDHCNVDKSWDKSTFDTEAEAQEYAARWLGHYDDVCPLSINTSTDYNGMGDRIEIRSSTHYRKENGK